jgi:hypothetical protein
MRSPPRIPVKGVKYSIDMIYFDDERWEND